MSTTTSKNQEKKILKKQIRAQHAITADTQIECSNQPTEVHQKLILNTKT